MVKDAAHAWNWIRKLTAVGIAQGLAQGLGLIAGFLVIRFLPTESYALYSLAYAMLGMMSVIADSGVTTGGIAEGGKVWQDPIKLGQVVATIIELRTRFAIWAIVVLVPVLLYLLCHQGAAWVQASLITVLVVAQFFLGLQISIFALPPSLHQWVAKTQAIAITQQAAKAAAIALGVWLVPSAAMAMAVVIPAQLWNVIQVRRLSVGLADLGQSADPEVRLRVLTTVRRIMPGAIYYALSGQITIWLISIFGTTGTLAKVGALGRLSQIFTLITAILTVLVIPRFARLSASNQRVVARYIQVMAFAAALVSTICVLVAIFPHESLWVLGKNYQDLEREVFLQALVGAVSLLAGLAFNLGAVRSVIIRPSISIPTEVFAQITLISFITFDTAYGALCFALFTAAVQLVLHMTYFFYSTSKNP